MNVLFAGVFVVAKDTYFLRINFFLASLLHSSTSICHPRCFSLHLPLQSVLYETDTTRGDTQNQNSLPMEGALSISMFKFFKTYFEEFCATAVRLILPSLLEGALLPLVTSQLRRPCPDTLIWRAPKTENFINTNREKCKLDSKKSARYLYV